MRRGKTIPIPLEHSYNLAPQCSVSAQGPTQRTHGVVMNSRLSPEVLKHPLKL